MDNPSRHRIFMILVTIALIVTSALWVFAPYPRAFAATIAAIGLIALSIPIYRPIPGRMSLCLVCFGLFAASCGWLAVQSTSVVWLLEWITQITGSFNKQISPLPPSGTPQYVVLASTFVAFICSLWWARDHTAMGTHPKSSEDDLSGKEFSERIQNFCDRLRVNLDRLDEETNWSEALFVPLEAEVEVRSGRRRQRRVTSLMNALRGNFEHRFLLVLGDPGSGKSVALRKLGRDLLRESHKTGKVPVYLNLRDWETPRTWSTEEQPSCEQIELNLREWVFKNLNNRLDIYARQFLSAYFDPMIKEGRFFFILDSFDEIAAILDLDERHPMVDAFSEAIGRFLGGMHGSRGILASRFFRKPSSQFNASCTLEIRPLSEERFAQLARKKFLQSGITKRLFSERPDLAAAARNPFLAALLVQYITNPIRSRNSTLPANRGEIFADYLTSRLNVCREILSTPNITSNDLLQALGKLADSMFSNFGSFEIPLQQLPPLLLEVENGMLVKAFEQSRILRVGQGMDSQISFTHRRFAEYLAARNLLNSGTLPLSDIPTDSLWRDTLVLYCEIAPKDEAARVAQYCWDQMITLRSQTESSSSEDWLKGLHCLRFLAEAFRVHPEAIDGFRKEFFEYVLETANEGDVLSAKWALEVAGLFNAEQGRSLLRAALKRNNPWIAETALTACRYVRTIDTPLRFMLIKAVSEKSYVELWAQRRDLDISLSTNPELKSIRFFFWSLLADSWIWGITLLLMIALIITQYASNTSWLLSSSSIYIWIFGVIMFALSSGFASGWWTSLIAPNLFMALMNRFILFSPFLKKIHSNPHLLIFLGLLPLALLPWFIIFIINSLSDSEFIPRLKRYLAKNRKDLAIVLCATGAFFAVLGSAIHCLNRAKQCTDFYAKLAWNAWPGILGITLAGALIYAFIIIIKRITHDHWINLRNRKNPDPISRDWIASIFQSFKTPIGRRLFVERLADVRKVEGEWPSGPPYVRNDWASAELARFDERWRGLNR